MTRPESIYHKSQERFQRKRRSSYPPGEERAAPDEPRDAGTREPPLAAVEPAAEEEAPSRRFRPNRRPGDPYERNVKANLVLYGGLGLVVIVYLLFLVGTFFFRFAAPRTAHPPALSPSASEERTPEQIRSDQEEAEEISRSIQAWKRADYVVEEAYGFMKKKRFADAEDRLQKAIESSPELVAVRLALTRLYVEQARYNEAKEHLMSVLERDPSQNAARIMLASIYSSEGNHAAALAVSTWILATDPFSVDAHRVAASAYLNTDQPGPALSHLRRLINLTGGDTITENSLAVVYSRLGQFDKATRILENLLVKDKANSITYYNLAVCRAQQRDTKGAVETLSLAVANFGAAFVEAWLDRPDFDPIRFDPVFLAFLRHAGLPPIAEVPVRAGQAKPGSSAPDTPAQEPAPVPEDAGQKTTIGD